MLFPRKRISKDTKTTPTASTASFRSRTYTRDFIYCPKINNLFSHVYGRKDAVDDV
jgi:hypothetical protein